MVINHLLNGMILQVDVPLTPILTIGMTGEFGMSIGFGKIYSRQQKCPVAQIGLFFGFKLTKP